MPNMELGGAGFSHTATPTFNLVAGLVIVLSGSVEPAMAEELLSVSPSPSRDQDVFGKELRLSGGCGAMLYLVVARQASSAGRLATRMLHPPCTQYNQTVRCSVEGERKQLSTAGDIFLSKTVHIDTHSKKGDGTEPRTLVSVWPGGHSMVQESLLFGGLRFLSLQ